jgi:DNA topoisomerase IB
MATALDVVQPRVRRLRRVDPSRPGFTRRKRGKGFEYLDQRGRRIDDDATIERIRKLAIPPAWTDVWISPDELGHIQAVGTDAAGRRQYRYHDVWRERRDRSKHERMEAFARRLPEFRATVAEDLAQRGVPKERVLACAARLLDRAFFRVGGESYAEQNGSYGLATIRRDHVEVRGSQLTFDYTAKGGIRRIQRIGDAELAKVVKALKDRDDDGLELLAWKDGSRWRDVRSADINDYLKAHAGEDVSAKDFRTWHATVLAAVVLAGKDIEATTHTSRKRLTSTAVKEVSNFLGNTPAVCRASYIDPRVIDRFMAGETIADDLRELGTSDLTDPAVQARIEAAVLELLIGDRRSSLRAA